MEIDKKLAELEAARQRLESERRRVEEKCAEIDSQLEDMRRRQRDRIVSDHRLDNRLIDTIQQGAEPPPDSLVS